MMPIPIDHLFDEDCGTDWDDLSDAEFEALLAAVSAPYDGPMTGSEPFSLEELPF